MIIFWALMALSVVVPIVHFFFSQQPKTKKRAIELLLLYQLVFNVGFISFLSFIGLMFLPELVAKQMGREVCRFQTELANVNLAFGVLGIMSIWFRGNFWIATIIGISIWLISDGIGHILDFFTKHHLPSHVKTMMLTDFLVPLVLLSLLFMYNRDFDKRVEECNIQR